MVIMQILLSHIVEISWLQQPCLRDIISLVSGASGSYNFSAPSSVMFLNLRCRGCIVEVLIVVGLLTLILCIQINCVSLQRRMHYCHFLNPIYFLCIYYTLILTPTDKCSFHPSLKKILLCSCFLFQFISKTKIS